MHRCIAAPSCISSICRWQSLKKILDHLFLRKVWSDAAEDSMEGGIACRPERNVLGGYGRLAAGIRYPVPRLPAAVFLQAAG